MVRQIGRMATARVSTKGQVVIPKQVRERLGLHAGDHVEFILHEDHAHLEKRPHDALAAFLAGPKASWVEGELERVLDEQYDLP